MNHFYYLCKVQLTLTSSSLVFLFLKIKIMKRILILIYTLFYFIFLSAQNETSNKLLNKKMVIYVIPFHWSFYRSLPYYRVKKIAGIKVEISQNKELAENTLDNYKELIDKMAEGNETERVNDFKVHCIFKGRFYKRKLYLTAFGSIYYKGKYYQNDTISKFIFSYIPVSAM